MKNYITHYAFRNLVGTNRMFFREFLSEITSFGKLMNRIDKFSEEQGANYGYSAGIHFETNADAINKFKGDLFEIFTEVFIKVNAFGNVLDITDYQHTKKDYPGVDAIGSVQGKKVAVQIKFLSDPRNHVDKDDMMGFYAVATGDLGVTANDSNLILITSSYEGIDYVKMNAVYRGILQKSIRIINHAIISSFIDNNIDLWGRVHNLIEDTIVNLDKITSKIDVETNRELIVLERIASLKDLPAKNSPYKAYTKERKITTKKDNEGNPIFKPAREIYNYSQYECYEKMQSTDKLSLILPTGTGKGYLLFVDLLSRIHYKNGKTFAICSHRIGLNKQHTNDMFDAFKDFAGDIGYVFVASETYQESDEKRNEYIAILKKINPNTNVTDIISTLRPGQSLQEILDYHHRNGRSVVIVSTYHSMQKLHGVDIDTIYCDEADKMVSNKPNVKNGIKDETFMQKFHKVRARKKYFFTATPKDWSKSWGGENVEFMNNEAIFGERIEMEFYAAVKSGYIVQPYLHILYPLEYDFAEIDCPDEEDMEEVAGENDITRVRDMNVNIKAKIKMIVEAFNSHKAFLKERSARPDLIGAKILVKCKNIRSEMWGIFHEGLREALPDIKLFAGGSYGYRDTDNNDYKNNNHYMYDPTTETTLIPIADRDTYLDKIKKLKPEEDAVVLHCDILSEGLNVKAFTAVCFISGLTQTDAKAAQNIGRGTRVIDEDRAALDAGDISVEDMSKWIKPFCSVIIPFWNAESAEAKDKMVELVTELRNMGFEIEKFGTGSDMNKDDKTTPDMETQNEPKLAKRKSGIRELQQELEELEHLQKINNMAPVDFIIEMTNDVFPNSKEFSEFWSM